MDPLETKSGDDALQEMTHIRHDLPGLLQVRPKMLKPSPSFPPPSYPRGAVSKGRGKGEQDKKQWENKRQGSMGQRDQDQGRRMETTVYVVSPGIRQGNAP